MIAALSRLLGLTHWLMMEIQQKLLNIYNAEVFRVKNEKYHTKFEHHIIFIAGEMQQHCETEENPALQYWAPFHG